MGVVGGVALIAGLVFLLAKFCGKRSGFNDGEADIKWPELKHNDEDGAAMQPLPARRTGGAGFDMGEESDNGHGYADIADDTQSMRDNGYGSKLAGGTDGGVVGQDSFTTSTAALTAASYGAGAVGADYGASIPTYYDQYGAVASSVGQRAPSPYYGHQGYSAGLDVGQNAMAGPGAVPYIDSPQHQYEQHYDDDYGYNNGGHAQMAKHPHQSQQLIGNPYH